MDNNNSPRKNTEGDDLFLDIARARHENAAHIREEATRQIPVVRRGASKSVQAGKTAPAAGRRKAVSPDGTRGRSTGQSAAAGQNAVPRITQPGQTAGSRPAQSAGSGTRAPQTATNRAASVSTQTTAFDRVAQHGAPAKQDGATRVIPRVERTSAAGTAGARTPAAGGRSIPSSAPGARGGAAGGRAPGAAGHGTAARASQPAAQRKGGSRRGRKGKDKEYNGTALSSVVKAMIYIAAVFVIGGLLGYYGVVIGNDVFALVKSTDEITVTIPDGLTTAELGDTLKEAGVIRFPGIFSLYGNLRHDSKPYIAGEYVVSPSMNFDQLRSAFHEKVPEATIISITIPEGYTTDEIIDLFLENGIGTREKFVDAIQNYNFEGYWFLDELEVKEGRRYRLDGYLYPDTYYFYTTASEVSVIYKLLDRFDEIFPDAYKDAVKERGFTVDEVVTLASMVQKEAKYESEFGWISSVFNNRLAHPNYETQGYLNSDATTLYGLDDDKGFVTGEDNEKDGPYNTYTRKGLPVGPIANPSYSAITWALYPAETDYYYFVAKKDGYNLFAKTAAEHAQNKAAALSDQ